MVTRMNGKPRQPRPAEVRQGVHLARAGERERANSMAKARAEFLAGDAKRRGRKADRGLNESLGPVAEFERVISAGGKLWPVPVITGVNAVVEQAKGWRAATTGNVEQATARYYTTEIMGNAAAKAAAARTFSDRELQEYIQWGEVAAAVLRERENKDRAPAEPRPELAATRLKWKEDRRPGEGVAAFAARAYAAEIGNGSFDKSVIRRDDMPLYQRLFRDKAWEALAARTQATVLTKPDRNTERLRELLARGEQPSRSEDIGLYEAGRYRVAHAKP